MNDRAVAESAVVRAEGEGGFKITLWDLDDAGEDEEEKSLGGVTFPGGSETITIAITNMPAQGGRTGEAKHVRFCSEVLATVPGKKPYPKAITTAPGDAAQGEGTWPDIWCPHYKAPYVGNLPMCPFTVFAPSDE